jgi:hypothetical protein
MANRVAGFQRMKTFTPSVPAAMRCGACESGKPNPNPSLGSTEVFDATMRTHPMTGEVRYLSVRTDNRPIRVVP